jgi:cbb3-type cytochrome oxidase maturation protein
MESLYLLIPVALIFCAVAIKLLLWAIDSGQYEDLDKESWRILNDDDGETSTAPRASQADAETNSLEDKP